MLDDILDRAERLEDLHQRLLTDVPRHAAEKDFRRVSHQSMGPWRKHAAPCTGCIVMSCKQAVREVKYG